MSATAVAEALAIDPTTQQVYARYPFDTADRAAEIVAQSSVAQRHWRSLSVEQRCVFLYQMAELLDRDVDALARSMTHEMGKPIRQARAEVVKTAAALRWYVNHGPAFLADQPTTVGAGTIVRFEPLGPVLSIQPWNFPIWQPMRAAMAILLAGNTYILKPAPNVVGSALLLERLWVESGLPSGVFAVLNAEPTQVADAIADPAVAAVTLTGSVGAGSTVSALAGRHVKKCVLELGGSDAFIVLADADLDTAVDAAVTARFQNTGQVCIAAKRFILDESISDDFTNRLLTAVQRLNVGNPLDESTDIGPMARLDLRDELSQQVTDSIAQGATLLCGGDAPEGAGFFYTPTVLSGVRPGMPAFDDETFGPVAALVDADDATHAIQLANMSKYGLSASIWTRDTERARGLAREIEVGGVFINSMPVSDPRIPIGGVKNSGYGRELSHFGVHEFVNAKAIWVNQDAPK